MDKKTKIFLSLATVAVLVLMITAIVSGNNHKTEFTPPPFEVNAQAGEVEDTDILYGKFDLPYEDGNKCSVGLEAMPIVSNDEIKVNFSSDKENTVWVRLVVTDKSNEIVCESGILKPGEYVENLKLNKKASSKDKLNAKIITFEPETYYSMGTASAALQIK